MVIKWRNHQTTLWQLLIVIAAFIVLISLGVWQLYRLEDKRLYLKTVSQALKSPALPYELLSISPNNYTRIKLTGYFLEGKDIYLYRQHYTDRNKIGYYLLTPFRTTNDQIILVIRGWGAEVKKKVEKSLDIISTEKKQEIIGITMPYEKSYFYLPNNDFKNNVWFILDFDDIRHYLNLPVTNFYLLSEEKDKENSKLQVIDSQRLINIRNDHLEYAITWFALAISLLTIFSFYTKSAGRKVN